MHKAGRQILAFPLNSSSTSLPPLPPSPHPIYTQSMLTETAVAVIPSIIAPTTTTRTPTTRKEIPADMAHFPGFPQNIPADATTIPKSTCRKQSSLNIDLHPPVMKQFLPIDITGYSLAHLKTKQ